MKLDGRLENYLRYAALHNPGLEAAFLRWKAALERSPQVRSLPDPRLTYSYFFTRVETRVGAQRQRIGVAQTFPWFGKLRLKGDIALAEAQAVYHQFQAKKLSLFYEVKDAYYELYYLGRAIAIAEENLDLLKRLEAAARARYRVGAAGHADLIRAQVELGKLEDRVRTLKDLRPALAARLNAALNRPSSAPVPQPVDPPTGRLELKDEQVLAFAQRRNPALRSLDARLKKSREGVALARKNYFPDVTLGLSYIDTASARQRVSESGKDPIVGTVSINAPIWYRKYRAADAEARAKWRAAAYDKADARNRLDARLKLALFKYRDAERKIDLYKNTLTPEAKQSLAAAETAYKAGRLEFLNLIDAERVLLAFQLAYERALADRAQRLAEIEMLMGREAAVAADASPASP